MSSGGKASGATSRDSEEIGSTYPGNSSSGYAPLGGAPVYVDPEAQTKFEETVSQSSVDVRLSFVRKVYS